VIQCAIYDRVRARSWARNRAAPQTARANALLSVRASERASDPPAARTQEKIPKTGLGTIFTGFFGALLGGA